MVSLDHLEELVAKVRSTPLLLHAIPQSLELNRVHHVIFSITFQVTKVALAFLALQVIQVSLVLKVTRDFKAYRDGRVSQEREGSQVFL